MRDHLENVHRQTGKMPAQLIPPVDMPEFLNYLWQWFCSLSGGRGYTENGPMPLSFSEIQAWAHLTKTDLSAWEVSALKQIDQAFLLEAMKK